MAQVEDEVYKILSTTGAITALVSTRIYPVPIPQRVTAFPSLTYERTGGGRINDLSGYTGLENPTIEVSIIADRATTLQAVSTVVLAAMEASTLFDSWSLTDQFDIWDDDIEKRVRTLEFSIWNQN